MKKNITVLFLIILFFVIRLPGISLPYHQDEFKLAMALQKGGSEMWNYLFFHPPLEGLSLYFDNLVFGNEYLRLLPLLISVFSAIFIFVYVKKYFNKRTAYISLAFFSLCFYSVWSSLMVDVDGAIMPFFFILSIWSYDAWKGAEKANKIKYLSLLLLFLLLGFLVKLSFILVVGTLIFDFILDNRKNITKKQVLYVVYGLFGFLFISALISIIAHYVFAFNINNVLSHAISFAHIFGRNWTQIIIQGIKAVYYLSPLSFVILLFINKDILKKTKVFSIYLIFGFIFYFILFDFSKGALDKYLMFSVLPIIIIVSSILDNVFSDIRIKNKGYVFTSIIIGLFISTILFYLNFINPEVVALYPKEEWFGRAMHFRWNMLNPFNGGSGPEGFYVSFLFIIMSFIVSGVLAIFAFFKKNFRASASIIIIMISIIYNLVFIEELIWGKINGNVSSVTESAISFIKNIPQIKGVITYNDTGAYRLSQIGKYSGRFYASPQFEESHKQRFAEHTDNNGGYFLIVDIPHINQNSFYGDYFSKCLNIFKDSDRKIEAKVFSCK